MKTARILVTALLLTATPAAAQTQINTTTGGNDVWTGANMGSIAGQNADDARGRLEGLEEQD